MQVACASDVDERLDDCLLENLLSPNDAASLDDSIDDCLDEGLVDGLEDGLDLEARGCST